MHTYIPLSYVCVRIYSYIGSAISVLMSHTYLSICSANISLGTQAKTCFETKTKRERTEKIALSTLMSHTYLSICSL